jgi:AraC-like DNA-binding protein
MEFRLHFPRAPLDRHVESITFYAGFAPPHDREKLIPDGAINIIVDLTDRPKKLYASETSPLAVDFRKSWISGMQRRWIVIEAQPQSSMLVIRFRPGGAYPFVGHDMDALSDRVFPLEEVIRGASSSLRDRILAAPTPAEKFAAAEAWLLERSGPAPSMNPTAAYLAARLGRPIGMRVRDAVEETGFTDRHVRNLFQRWIGVSPKQYARISRFQHLLGTLARDGVEDPELEAPPLPSPDWAVVAAEAGYADQSHLTHEFQSFAGTTPANYVAAYGGLTNYLPITLPR